MKEIGEHDEGMSGAPSEPTSQATADPQVIDAKAPEPAPSQTKKQTRQEMAQPEAIAQAAEAEIPAQEPAQTAVSQEAAGPDSSIVLIAPGEKNEALAPSSPQPAGPPSPEGAQVHIAPNLLDLTTGRVETPAEKREAKKQRDLNQVVHTMLVVGLAISTVLMLIGIALEIIRRQDLPTVEPDFSQVFARVVALRPSGFLALGLLVLLATPILRVLGSIFAFAYERDWRFVGITFVVLMVVIASIWLGKG